MSWKPALLLFLGCLACASTPKPPAAVSSASLTGGVWSTTTGQRIPEAELDQRLGEARFILLGESHDNAEHHQLQADVVRRLLRSGHRPTVAFEMLESTVQAEVDAAAPNGPDALAQAVAWDQSGWPAFSLYRPLFVVTLEAKLPVLAANLPRTVAKDIALKGAPALPPAEREDIEASPLPEEVEEALMQRLRESHCGHLPESRVGGFLFAQQARDAHLAARLKSVPGQVVLIAGTGHVRRDHGVPHYLGTEKVISIAFLEQPDVTADSWREEPFDYVVFTSSQPRADPCAGFRMRSTK